MWIMSILVIPSYHVMSKHYMICLVYHSLAQIEPRYDGLSKIDMFIKACELQVPEQHRLLKLDDVLKATPARWWDAHRKGMKY